LKNWSNYHWKEGNKEFTMQITKLELARMIDHTLLRADATPETIIKHCEQAKNIGFAAVCVHPCHVGAASRFLEGSITVVCTVVGFPFGANEPSIKAAEAAAAVYSGASEIDVVLNAGLLKGGLADLAMADLEGVVRASRREKNSTIVKVILETSLLNDQEKVEGCRLAVESGADFVKTSTGFGKGGATVWDVSLLRRTVGPGVGVKASGGISDLSTALLMIHAGASRLGTSSGTAIINQL